MSSTLSELCAAHNCGSAASVSRITGIPLRTLNDWVIGNSINLCSALMLASTSISMSAVGASDIEIRARFIVTVAGKIHDLTFRFNNESAGELEFLSNILRRACDV